MSKALDIPAEAQGVLDFWFGEATPEQWFRQDDGFDATIRERFATLFARAVSGELAGWRESARGCLALVIVLDQFPRNLFRGGARSFATDAPARAVLHHALEKGFDDGFPFREKQFLYMPLMHSEDSGEQARSVALYTALGDEDVLDFARRHKDIIDRFGRFPHRNESLGRKNTPEESEFLKQKGSSF
jgi:uncharacterized protein (DUF924 family)